MLKCIGELVARLTLQARYVGELLGVAALGNWSQMKFLPGSDHMTLVQLPVCFQAQFKVLIVTFNILHSLDLDT